MKNFIVNIVKKATTATLLFAGLVSSAMADIPTVEANSDGVDGTGGFWGYITGWVKDIMVFVPLVVMSAATIWISWSLLQKVLAERQTEKPNWGSVFAHAGASVLLLVITVFLGNQTMSVWA